MEITLNSKEINQALIAFVSNKMKINPDQKIQIEYKAGRGENGPSASIIIGESDNSTGKIEEYESEVEKLNTSEAFLNKKTEIIEPITKNYVVKSDIDSDPDNHEPIVVNQLISENIYSEAEHEEDDL